MWLLRIGLAVLGLAGFAGYLWVHYRSNSSGGGAHDEVDLLLHEANARLQASHLGSAATVTNLPAIFLLGDTGTAKTSTVLQCGTGA